MMGSINNTTYDLFFNSIYRSRAAMVRLEEVYRKRWCKPAVLNLPRPRKLAESAAKHLRWISKRLPPRVKLVCVYDFISMVGTQGGDTRGGTHPACFAVINNETEDSIEHIIQCDAIQDLFPCSMKTNHAKGVPPSHFFFYGLDGRHRLTFALMLYAIYSVSS